MSTTPLLQLTGLTKHFGGLPALQAVSFAILPGQIIGLIGPNGAGKTTLINCLSGVVTPDWGTITLAGQDITQWPPHQRARLGLSRTFQNLRLFPHLTVLENVLCGLTVQTSNSFWRALVRPPSLRHRERQLRLQALDALDTYGLPGKGDLPAAILPYGEKKKVELARAFVSNPLLTLLDEPVAGLNTTETAEIAAIIRKMRQAGKTILLVEHDLDLVMSVADAIVVLDSGRVIAWGPPAAVQRNPLVLEAYLGRLSPTA
jgi:branched-chain amino acid transport system ATP-binding protein